MSCFHICSVARKELEKKKSIFGAAISLFFLLFFFVKKHLPFATFMTFCALTTFYRLKSRLSAFNIDFGVSVFTTDRQMETFKCDIFIFCQNAISHTR